MGHIVKVILQPIKFRKRSHIAILSPNNPEIDEVIREFENSEWSTGYRFWHLPLTPSIVREIKQALKGIAHVDSTAFKNYRYEYTPESPKKRERTKVEKPSDEQQLKLNKFKQAIIKKGYSDGTVKVYVSMLNVFFGWFNQKKDNEITDKDIESFLDEYIAKNQLTENYKRLMTNSLRRYFDFIDKTDLSSI